MLYTFVLDLKLTAEGGVKILETQDTLLSGSQGYEQAYGECVFANHIMPFYKRQFGLPVYTIDGRMAKPEGSVIKNPGAHCIGLGEWNRSQSLYQSAAAQHPEKPDYHSDDISTHSAILAPFYLSGYYSAHVRAEQKRRVKVVNDNKVFIAATCSKFLQNYFLTPLIKDLAPEETSVLMSDVKDMAAKIKAAVSSDYIVLKTPEDARAEGVIVAPREKLEQVLHFLVSKPHKDMPGKPDNSLSGSFNHQAWRYGQWAGKGVIVAQSLEKSRPVVNEQDGQTYDPTMRVFASIWREKGQTQFKLHGGYWKFPAEPACGNTSSKNMISASPSKKPGGRVAPEDMACVESRLAAVLPDAFETLDNINMTDVLRDCIAAPDDLKIKAVAGYMSLVRGRDIIETLSVKEVRAFGEVLADHDLRVGTFIIRNVETGRASPSACLGQNSEKFMALKQAYGDRVEYHNKIQSGYEQTESRIYMPKHRNRKK